MGPKVPEDGIDGGFGKEAEGSLSGDRGAVLVWDRYDGCKGGSCAFVFGSASAIFSGSGCANSEECIGTDDIQRVPQDEEAALGGELWNDGYFVRSVGDKITSEIIRRYIKYQQ
jgi:hypothetical protein